MLLQYIMCIFIRRRRKCEIKEKMTLFEEEEEEGVKR